MNEKLCSECGTVIPEGSENCPNCGNPVTDSPVMPEPSAMMCSECGNAIPMGAESCPNCGNPVSASHVAAEPAVKYCGKCGTKMELNQKFCPNCGTKSGTKKKGNIIVPIIAVIIVVVIGVLAVVLIPPKVESVSVPQSSVEIEGGETFQAICTITPEKAAQKTETVWESNNESVATVTETGLITAVSDGTAQITVTAGDKSASISVTVKTGPDFKAIAKKVGTGVYIKVADDGSYMSIDTNWLDIDDYYDADATDAIKKANKELGLPDSVYQKMLTTTSIQGRQEYAENGVKVSWTYHPDYGLEVMYEKVED